MNTINTGKNNQSNLLPMITGMDKLSSTTRSTSLYLELTSSRCHRSCEGHGWRFYITFRGYPVPKPWDTRGPLQDLLLQLRSLLLQLMLSEKLMQVLLLE